MDRRELILAREFVVLTSIPGFVTHARNRGLLADELRPAIQLLDGDEAAAENLFVDGARGPQQNIVTLSPEIYVTLEGRKPQNVGVGPSLNAYRILIVKALLIDVQLKTLLGTNGDMHYHGCTTDFRKGQNMDGEMGINISLSYAFKPSEL